MKRRILAAALALSLVFGATGLMGGNIFSEQAVITAVAETYGDYEYEVLDDGTVEIIGYTGDDDEVTIPSKIDGKKVTSIGSYAFYNCQRLESITIPNTVTKIRDSAFHSCARLQNIIIPDSVTSIEFMAFSYCTMLESITIPYSVTSIGQWTFSGCDSLKSIDIPDSVTSIGGSAFSGTPWLNAKIAENPLVIVGDGILIDGSTCSGVVNIPNSVKIIGDRAFMYCANLESITIPNSVISIEEYAFSSCDNLKSIDIPDSVTNIGDSAFSGCESLKSVKIGNSVKSIGDWAFDTCTSLESIDVPDSVINMGEYTFYDCENLKNVVIGNGVTSIGTDTFFGCKSLENVVIGNSVKSIGNNAFSLCISLKEINIPASVEIFETYAFSDCQNLTNFVVAEDSKYLCDIDGVVFSKDKTEIIVYPIGKTSSYYEIPNYVTSIGNSAFADCTVITEITIPDTVTKIGDYAFDGCTGLTNVTIPDSVKEIGWRAFYDCSMTSIVIPASVENIDGLAFGYCHDPDYWLEEKIDGFIIYCYAGTAGEEYAKKWRLDYKIIEDHPTSGTIKVAGEKDTAGVDITLTGADKKPYTAQVSADGTFSLPDLADGSYTLTASKDGYVYHDYAVTIKNGAPTEDISVELKRPGDISGDGKITAVDSAMVNAYVMKTGTLDDYNQKVADVIGNDGSVTAVDCSRINAHVQKTNLLW